jgi:biopolymer transport protein ExbD
MAMNVGSAGGDEDEIVSTINTTPLVDVMLVLLIIFLITIPVVTTSIPVQLPKERNEVRETKPENIVLSVDQQGRIYWNDLKIANTQALIDRLKKVALLTQPEVQIRGDGGSTIPSVGSSMRVTRRYREGRLHHRAAGAGMPRANAMRNTTCQ